MSAQQAAIRWVVRCADHITKPYATKQAAELAAASITAAGHCQQTHTVEQVKR